MPKPTRGALVLLTGAAVGLTGCSKTVSSRDVEKKVGKTLSAQVGQKVNAKCPGKLDAKKGKTYDCTVIAADGSRAKIRLTMLDDSGKFSFQGAGAAGATK
jgi:hypothetical protein